MKNAKNIAILATLVFAVGIVGINFSDSTFALQDETSAVSMATGSLLGHLEIVHTDSDGNILSYQQTDNVITNDGRNCTAMLLFGATGHGSGNGCTATAVTNIGVYDFIGIGNGTALGPNSAITALNTEIGDEGIVRTQGTTSITTNATGTDGDAIINITNQFQWLGGTVNVVNQAGLFNQSSAGSAFALKDFGSSVSMNTNDLLTVNWDITITG